MASIGFHASHELHRPSALLRYLQRAEKAGFAAAMCSDHFHPWTPQQGQSGYSFAWLGAALQATSFSLGTICCPFQRYRPAIIAQAAATLAEMFLDRFWLAVGTGQALNESITGEPWPAKSERQRRLLNAVEIIRSLWAGETVTRTGLNQVERATLYSRPERPPLLLGAAITPQTAEWIGSWADGLLTVSADSKQLEEVVDAFRQGGGEGKPMFLQSMIGYDVTEERAWQAAARNWPVSVLQQDQIQNVANPIDFAALTSGVSVTELRGRLRVSSDLSRHTAWLQEALQFGFDRVFLYTISGEVEQFIDHFGEHVLPEVNRPKH